MCINCTYFYLSMYNSTNILYNRDIMLETDMGVWNEWMKLKW